MLNRPGVTSYFRKVCVCVWRGGAKVNSELEFSFTRPLGYYKSAESVQIHLRCISTFEQFIEIQ